MSNITNQTRKSMKSNYELKSNNNDFGTNKKSLDKIQSNYSIIPKINKKKLSFKDSASSLNSNMQNNFNNKGILINSNGISNSNIKHSHQVNISDLNNSNTITKNNLESIEEDVINCFLKLKYLYSKSFMTSSDRENIINNMNLEIDSTKDCSNIFNINCENIPIMQKLNSILAYTRLSVEEKLNFYSNSKQEVKNIDNILVELKKDYKVQSINNSKIKNTLNNNFNQQNFKKLIERVQIFINAEEIDKKYIESLKLEVINLQRININLVNEVKKVIIELKEDNLKLIHKIEILETEKDLYENNYNEVLKKIDDIDKKELENKQLKKDIDILKSQFVKEKVKLQMIKEKELKEVDSRLKYMIKLEKEKDKNSNKYIALKNKITNINAEKSKYLEINNKLYGDFVKLENDYYLNLNDLDKTKKLWRKSRETLNL